MHADEVLCRGENGGAIWETSNRGCILRKVVSKEVTAGGRLDCFLDSALYDPSFCKYFSFSHFASTL